MDFERKYYSENAGFASYRATRQLLTLKEITCIKMDIPINKKMPLYRGAFFQPLVSVDQLF